MPSFKSSGNLAFYDGWSPNYVYFKSLLSYAHNASDKKIGLWDPKEAGDIAAHAAMDAYSHMRFNGMNKQDSDQYFLNKFQRIVTILERAIAAEKASENAYIDSLLKKLKKSFSAREQKELTQLNNLRKLLIQAKTSDEVEYDAINAEINVLLQGFDNTKTIINYEAERIKKINSILTRLLKSRGNQAAGVGKSQDKDIIAQQQMADNAKKRLWNKIVVEYSQSGQLTRNYKNKGKNKFVLFGGKELETEVPKAIDRVLADWMEQMIEKLTSDKKFISNIGYALEKHYPEDGNFNWLETKTQETIIQAILDQGIGDLQSILDNTISDALVKRVERYMLTHSEKIQNDMEAKYEIKNLSNFGLLITEPELMKEASDLASLQKKQATQLFDKIRTFLEDEKELTKDKLKTSESHLITAMRQTKSTTKEKVLDQVENLISVIEDIETLQKEVEKTKKQWKKKIKEATTPLEEFNKQVKFTKNSSATINIKIIKGEVKVEQSDLIELLKNDERFKSFNFKDLSPKSLETTLSALKARASIILKDDIIKSIRHMSIKIPEADLIAQVKHELRHVTVKINGPTLAELLTGIYLKGSAEKVMVDWNKYKGKNDSVAIVINHRNFVHTIQNSNLYTNLVGKGMEKDLENLQNIVEQSEEKLLLEYQTAIDNAVESLTNTNDKEKYSKLIQIMNTDFENIENQDEKVQQAYQDLKEAVKNLQEYIKTTAHRQNISIKNIDLNKIGKEYLHSLQNAFYISTTVKSANDYVNALGFKGGTLGSSKELTYGSTTVDMQLARIQDIFTAAGTPIGLDELEWLRSAIINCFPSSVVGERNKNLIENYLGSLIAFALFDEGAVETSIINKFQSEIVTAITEGKAQKFIHLYVVDGLYIKGSTVLERTLNTLTTQVLPNIENIPKVMHRGAGITIINTTSEAGMKFPNRPYKEHLDNADPGAWDTVGNEVSSNVNLQILFLAGLLDIINGINNALGKVELPK